MVELINKMTEEERIEFLKQEYERYQKDKSVYIPPEDIDFMLQHGLIQDRSEITSVSDEEAKPSDENKQPSNDVAPAENTSEQLSPDYIEHLQQLAEQGNTDDVRAGLDMVGHLNKTDDMNKLNDIIQFVSSQSVVDFVRAIDQENRDGSTTDTAAGNVRALLTQERGKIAPEILKKLRDSLINDALTTQEVMQLNQNRDFANVLGAVELMAWAGKDEAERTHQPNESADLLRDLADGGYPKAQIHYAFYLAGIRGSNKDEIASYIKMARENPFMPEFLKDSTELNAAEEVVSGRKDYSVMAPHLNSIVWDTPVHQDTTNEIDVPENPDLEIGVPSERPGDEQQPKGIEMEVPNDRPDNTSDGETVSVSTGRDDVQVPRSWRHPGLEKNWARVPMMGIGGYQKDSFKFARRPYYFDLDKLEDEDQARFLKLLERHDIKPVFEPAPDGLKDADKEIIPEGKNVLVMRGNNLTKLKAYFKWAAENPELAKQEEQTLMAPTNTQKRTGSLADKLEDGMDAVGDALKKAGAFGRAVSDTLNKISKTDVAQALGTAVDGFNKAVFQHSFKSPEEMGEEAMFQMLGFPFVALEAYLKAKANKAKAGKEEGKSAPKSAEESKADAERRLQAAIRLRDKMFQQNPELFEKLYNNGLISTGMDGRNPQECAQKAKTFFTQPENQGLYQELRDCFAKASKDNPELFEAMMNGPGQFTPDQVFNAVMGWDKAKEPEGRAEEGMVAPSNGEEQQHLPQNESTDNEIQSLRQEVAELRERLQKQQMGTRRQIPDLNKLGTLNNLNESMARNILEENVPGFKDTTELAKTDPDKARFFDQVRQAYSQNGQPTGLNNLVVSDREVAWAEELAHAVELDNGDKVPRLEKDIIPTAQQPQPENRQAKSTQDELKETLMKAVSDKLTGVIEKIEKGEYSLEDGIDISIKLSAVVEDKLPDQKNQTKKTTRKKKQADIVQRAQRLSANKTTLNQVKEKCQESWKKLSKEEKTEHMEVFKTLEVKDGKVFNKETQERVAIKSLNLKKDFQNLSNLTYVLSNYKSKSSFFKVETKSKTTQSSKNKRETQPQVNLPKSYQIHQTRKGQGK